MTIEINEKDFKKLKSLYNKAIEEKEKKFIFKGQILLVDYAKYLIEHLNTKFKPTI